MNGQRRLALISCIPVFGLAFAVVGAEPVAQGIEAYRQSNYQLAVAEFRSAADRGDARAQEILGFMHLYGSSFYGRAVAQDRSQAIYWFSRAAQNGREVAQHMLCVLSGRPADTVVNRAACVGPRVRPRIATQKLLRNPWERP